MKNLLVLPVAVCLLAFVAADANAQYGYYGPQTGYYGPQMGYYGSPYGGGAGCCGSNYTDPRLGYCLKNDCFCGGGMGGCGMGCGGGMSVTVRVTTGGDGSNPMVRTYYPQIQGCNGCYGNQTRPAPQTQAKQNVATSRYRSPQRATSSARYPTKAKPQSQSVSYRYKF